MRSKFIMASAIAVCAISVSGQAGAQTTPTPTPTVASSPAPSPAHPTLQELRSRDRFGVPAQELAAWEAYIADIAARQGGVSMPATEAGVANRAEALLGRAIARFYAKQPAESWADTEAALNLTKRLAEPPSFRPELLAYGTLALLDLDRSEEAATLADEALALAAQQVANAPATIANTGPNTTPNTALKTALANLALANNVQGSVAFAANDLPEAERRFCRARDLSLQALPPTDAMIVTNASTCGVIKYFLERPDTMAAMRFAADHASTHLPPDHPRTGLVLNNGYGVLVSLGRYGEAAPLARRHLELERSLHAGTNGGAVDDVFDPLAMLGKIQAQRGRLEEAEALARAAADMAAAMDSGSQPYRPGIAKVELGRYLAMRGKLAEAEDAVRGGLSRLTRDVAPDDANLGNARQALADILDRRGDHAAALEQIDAALALLAAKLPDDHSEVLSARMTHARILANLGEVAAARPEATAASAIFEGLLFDLAAGETDRVALSRIAPAMFGSQLHVALAADDMEGTLRAAQLQLLSDLAVTNARIGAGSAAREAGLSALVDALDKASGELEAQEKTLRAAQAEGADTGELTVMLVRARTERDAGRRTLTEAFPDYAALLRPQIPSLTELQAGLPTGALAIFPILLPDRAVTIAVGRDTVTVGETASGPEQVLALTARTRAAMERAGDFDSGAAAALYRTVFPEALDIVLDEHTQLLFPASGYLARIAPGALLREAPSGGELADARWLIRSHAIRIVSDFGALVTLRANEMERDPRNFLGVGAPTSGEGAGGFAAGLPSLATAEGELEALRDALRLGGSNDLLLTGSGATEAALGAQNLRDFATIAFATHGLVSGEVDGLFEPALVMTATDGTPGGDGLLTASEIAGLRLDADWVLLSACNTGSGSEAGAPGFSGLARAFRSAGARGLLLSHWRVRDDAAARLSVETVRGTANGASRAEALRHAQLSLMADASVADAAHPAIWAPFVLIED